MKSQIEILKHLQELVLARDEHYAHGDGSQIDRLTDEIESLKSELDVRALALFDRIYKRNHLVLAQVVNGCCAGCGMAVPVSMAQMIKRGEHLVACQACGRVLCDDGSTVVLSKGSNEEDREGFERFSSPEMMVAELASDEREAVVYELAKLMEKTGRVHDAAAIVDGTLQRESILSTAMNGGVALPHVRGVENSLPAVAIGVSKSGVKWDDDGNIVNLVVLASIPVSGSAFYMNFTANFLKVIADKKTKEEIIAVKSNGELWKLIEKKLRKYWK